MKNTYQPAEAAGSAHRAIADHPAPKAIAYAAVPALQKKDAEEDELQMKPAGKLKNDTASGVNQGKENIPSSMVNKTGMPNQLKAGIENLSRFSMDDVKVHYNSSQPAQLNALAYAQGTDIHIGPGQERHLPHEAWHVVQQKQGRVKPTMQMKDVGINDDKGLEKEADVMGKKAVQMKKHKTIFQFMNDQFEVIAQRKQQETMNIDSLSMEEPKNLSKKTNNRLKVKETVQLEAMTENHSAVIQLNGDKPSGGTGTSLGNLFRTGINGIANFFGGINRREHHYETPPIRLGSVHDIGNAKEVMQQLSNGPIDLTVPGAIKGKGGKLFGNREEGGTAYAVIGGPVTTESNVDTLTISNVVQDGHLFGGRIDQRIYEEDGQVMSKVVGSGYGNFAKINEILGIPLFVGVQENQRNFLSNKKEKEK